jgi:hypothetical protein
VTVDLDLLYPAPDAPSDGDQSRIDEAGELRLDADCQAFYAEARRRINSGRKGNTR